MKKIRKGLIILVIAAVCVPALSAQSLKGMSFNGATGLYNVPSGRIGWERSSNLGLDFGYHGMFKDGSNHIAKASISLFKWVEIATAFDFQERFEGMANDDYEPNNDLIISAKVQLPTKNTAVAVGGNLQFINMGNDHPNHWIGSHTAGQIYVAATYPGTFFKMPAETTFMIGYSFYKDSKSNIDFGMGFDLILFPDIFDRYIHWLVDFSNYSYTLDVLGGWSGSRADAWYRGCLNTGVRIDLGAIPALNKFKFVIDAVMVDAFDEDRAFALGVVFGLSLM